MCYIEISILDVSRFPLYSFWLRSCKHDFDCMICKAWIWYLRPCLWNKPASQYTAKISALLPLGLWLSKTQSWDWALWRLQLKWWLQLCSLYLWLHRVKVCWSDWGLKQPQPPDAWSTPKCKCWETPFWFVRIRLLEHELCQALLAALQSAPEKIRVHSENHFEV